jgi:hypothetical protein
MGNGKGRQGSREEDVTHCSSIFGWKMRLTKPMLGELYGYASGSSTCTFQRPSAKGAGRIVSDMSGIGVLGGAGAGRGLRRGRELSTSGAGTVAEP